MRTYQIVLVVFSIFVLAGTSTVSAAHFITGFVNNSFNGENANGYIITVWNPAIGLQDNVTDIIGPSGNSGADNIYFVDCELLTTPCVVGDELYAQVFDAGGYTTPLVNVTVTGAGFDVMADTRLNSPPNASLQSPIDFANVSSASLMCAASDLDGNLANMTLYGTWNGGWHANTTNAITGFSNETLFTPSLTEGTYEWSCLATDTLSISAFAPVNYTFTYDVTPPSVSGVTPNVTGPYCGVNSIVRVSCTAIDALTGIDSVFIATTLPDGTNENSTASVLFGDTYYADITLSQVGIWNFTCFANDTAGNLGSAVATNLPDVRNESADLVMYAGSVSYSPADPIENTLVTLNATVINEGCAPVTGALGSFYDADPTSGGGQIGSNQSITVSPLENTTYAVTWPAVIGTTTIYAVADSNNSIVESNETNNQATASIFVSAWQDFYGNITLDKVLGSAGSSNITLWFNESAFAGNVFFADTEADISWNQLLAIGTNITGQATTNDFSDIDTLLSMTSFTDSVSNFFTSDGITPLLTQTFFVYQQNITNVPIINSTNTANFVTGIMWDTSDDTNGEFDTGDQEDFVFVTEVNQDAQGAYGQYDYEITIPARLREVDPTDSNDVFIYFDLH